jgi:hypothetical protein
MTTSKGPNDSLPVKENVIALVRHADGSVTRHETHNIVTNEGDKYYAQKACGETPTNAFTNLVLGSTGTPSTGKASNYGSITPIASTSKAVSTGYPKTNDNDANNTGAGVAIVTWKFAYSAGDFTAASVTEGIVTTSAASATDPVLNHFAFVDAFAVTATDALTVFVNHEMSGSA